MFKPLPPEIVADMVDRFENRNKSLVDLEAELPYSRKRIAWQLKEAGCDTEKYRKRRGGNNIEIPRKKRRMGEGQNPLDEDVAALCVRMFNEEGKCHGQIFRQLRLCPKRVTAALRAGGCDMHKYVKIAKRQREASKAKKLEPLKMVEKDREYPFLTQARFEAVDRLAAQGLDPIEIAFQVGSIGSDTVRAHLHRDSKGVPAA